MKVVAMSRRFPPDYKRKWFVCRCSEGHLVRYEGQTITIYFQSLDDALEFSLGDMPKFLLNQLMRAKLKSC